VSASNSLRASRDGMTHDLWSVAFVDLDTVEEKANSVAVFALTLAEGAHQLVEFGGSLDFEEDFVVVVRDLDVEMLS
jgi:hypothetical protein